MKLNRAIFKDKLESVLMCSIQHDGWPCNSCFHTMDSELNLKKDIHKYWEAVLDFRGDYDDYDWPINVDTSQFPELIEELYECLIKKGDNMNITGMLAVGNGEPCPLCVKEGDRKVKNVFISQPDNDILKHAIKEHRKELSQELFGGDNEELTK